MMLTDFDQVFGGEEKITELFRQSYMQKQEETRKTIEMIIEDSPKKESKEASN